MPAPGTAAKVDTEKLHIAPWRHGVPVAIALGIIVLAPRPAAITPEGWRLFGIFAGTIAGLITQPISGGALVLLSVTLASIWGGLGIQKALGGYGDPTVWLVVAAFFISRALIKTGLARRIALFFVRAVGNTSLGVCYALSLSDMALAGIIPSNAARSGGVILPIVRSIAELYGSYPGEKAVLLGSFLMAGVYQSICVTAAMFFTGQASNPLAARMAAESFGYSVTWTGWLVAAVVPGLVSLAVVPLVVYRLNQPAIRRTPEAAAFARRELMSMGPMSRAEKFVFAVFLAVCGGWIASPWHGLDIAVPALLGSSALMISGVLTWEDVKNERAAWDIFVWYGGVLMLGKSLGEAGVPRAFAGAVGGLFGNVGWMPLLAIALLVYFYAHYGFASITSHILAMYAPFGLLLISRGAPPGLVAFSFACFTNLAAGLTNFGTTPAPMFYAQDYVSFRRWWTTGAAVSIVNIAIWSTIGSVWWKLIGLW